VSHHHPHRTPLELARDEIDDIDAELIRLLARRERVVAGLWTWKQATGRPLRDGEREREAFVRLRVLAARAELSPEAVERVFREIVGQPLAARDLPGR
jgi:chorismate mutase / prephenate dehydrogenase